MRLSATDVSHRYGRSQHPVLQEISLEVKLGEKIAVMGPSGSGKTTLLAILGGMLKPTSGHVDIATDKTTDAVADYVAWVLQTTNVLPDRSTLDNVIIGGFSAGLRREAAASQASLALASVGLSAVASRPVRQLSGGEVQRVAAARAITSGRPFILADEPTGQLDQATSVPVLDALLAHSADRAVVVVTHDPAVADRCDRVYRLENARLAQE
ncbi:MAG: ATP-binding cassette domain-containing protein [Acidimicrobiia bacterium]|jgi:ABC-type lipoprotein export system ATPase subunit|nr:ATP-binding cassette domain-containing protein [Acidimicrobiia bacterium]MDX2466409.1 ATP-binding cassette domain-containing protein [Acidimicrobiia bacterium]